MKNREIFIIIICLSCFTFPNYGNSLLQYKFNDETFLFDFVESNATADLSKLVKLIEKEYDVTIKLKKTSFFDNSYAIEGYIVNILTPSNYQMYFNGPSHRSILIETIILNILQPYNDTLHLQVEFIVVKMNDTFVSKLSTDLVYRNIYTMPQLLNKDNYYNFETLPDYLKK